MTHRPPHHRPRAGTIALALAALTGAGRSYAQTSPTPDQPAANRPEAARRIVRFFDFNTPDPFGLPLVWKLAQDGFPVLAGHPRPGFPIYNGAELQVPSEPTPDPAASAPAGAPASHPSSSAIPGHGGAMRLWTRGGSTSLRLSPGVIPVFPDTEYLVSGRIRTDGLSCARACLVARFLDRTDEPIPGSEVRSDLIASPESGDPWRAVSVYLPNAFSGAAYLQIDLEILQPEQFQAPELGVHQVWPQDYAGSAWFDDVAVVQLPRVEISTNSPVNVIVGGEHPAVDVSIRDLSGEALTGVLTLQDASGRVIDTQTRPLDSGRAAWQWQPQADRFGWYRASLDLSTRSRRVGGTYIDFAWVPASHPAASSADRARFGLIVSELPPDRHALVAQIAEAVGSGSITLPAWAADLTAEDAPRFAQDLGPLIHALRLNNQSISFSLPRLPDALAAATHLERENPAAVFAADPKLWSPYLLPLIDKYGQTVQRWQIGAVGDNLALSPRAPVEIAAAQSFLAKLVPGPAVAVPWPAELLPASPVPGASDAILSLPYQTPDLADLVGAWRASPWPASATFVPEPLPQPQFSRHDSVQALARRIVEFWRTLSPPAGSRSMAQSLALLQPWTWPTPEHDQLMPSAELPVLANLIQRLEGRRIVGEFPAGPGITCYILAPTAPGRTGALVAWSSASPDPSPALDAYLGSGPVNCIDIWGNASRILPAPSLSRGPELIASGAPPKAPAALTHHIPLSSEPVFVENIDVALAQFVASFRVEPAVIQSTGGDHDLRIVLSNPFTSRIDGTLSILEPGGLSDNPESRDRAWRISPRVLRISIGPGQTVEIPINASFSAMEEAGPKPFVAEARVVADREYAPIRLRTQVELKLDSIELDVSTRRAPGPGGPDLIVEAQATNRTDKTVTLEISAYAPGYPRAKAAVADLAPCATVTRRFFFAKGAVNLKGDRITVGAQNPDTQARINRSIPVE